MDPRNATVTQCLRSEAEDAAARESDAEPWGVWVPGALIAICYQGQVFRRA
jgi:hypothetical protein